MPDRIKRRIYVQLLSGGSTRGNIPVIIARGNISRAGEYARDLSLPRLSHKANFIYVYVRWRNELEFIAARSNVCLGARLSSQIKLDLTLFCFHAKS